MQYNSFADKYIENLERKIEDALIVVGAQGVAWASDNLRDRLNDGGLHFFTSNLINSLCYATVKEQGLPKGNTTGTVIQPPLERLKVRIGTNVVYALIQEFGGPIKPSKAQALSIPVAEEARNKSPRDFNDLVLIKPAYSDTPLLVKMNADKKTFKVMYILVKAVQIKGKPYLRPVVERGRALLDCFINKIKE